MELSVLMPNYNNGPYLKESMESLLDQTFADFQIVFVDDGSTDNSLEIMSSYDDPRLKIIKKEQNSGIVDTMNKALEVIDTRYFIRMDGDDKCAPERFEKMVQFMNEHPEIGVCSSDMKMFGLEDEVIHFERDPMMNKAELIFCQRIGHPTSIFRTKILKDNNLIYLDRFWRMEDYDLFYRLKDFTLLCSIPGEYYLYRRQELNTDPRMYERKKGEFLKFYAMIMNDLGLQVSDEDLRVHLQLAGRDDPTFGFEQYTDHTELLLKTNAQTGLFPQKELEIVLNKALDKIIYPLIDSKRIGFFKLIPFLFKKPSLLRYYLAKNLKS
jgi:glycosyltransferase involved in cell wall biosynthesis